MNKGYIAVITLLALGIWSHDVFAWKCAQACPEDFWSGSAECKLWKKMHCDAHGEGAPPSFSGRDNDRGGGSSVCLYNKADRTVNYTIEWDTCSDASGSLKSNTYVKVSCPNEDAASLVLQWRGYQAEGFRFGRGGSANADCFDSGSLTINPTAPGYSWNVVAGKP